VFGSLSCRCFSSSRYRESLPVLVQSRRVQTGQPNKTHTPNLNTVLHIHHTHSSENSPVAHLLRYTSHNTHTSTLLPHRQTNTHLCLCVFRGSRGWFRLDTCRPSVFQCTHTPVSPHPFTATQ